MRTALKFQEVDEDPIDIDRKLSKIKKRLLRKYHKVFKDKLDKHERLKIDAIKLELIEDHKEVCATNHMVPYGIPCHLQDAADKELYKLLKTRVLEPVEHPTDWYSHGFLCKITPSVDRRPKHALSNILGKLINF